MKDAGNPYYYRFLALKQGFGQEKVTAKLFFKSYNFHVFYSNDLIFDLQTSPAFPSQTLTNWLEGFFYDYPVEKNFISQIHHVFQSVALPSLDRVKATCDDDFGERISDEI